MFFQSKFVTIALNCVVTFVPRSVFKTGNPFDFAPYTRPVAKCIAQNLTSCSAEGRLSFYKGGLGAADAMDVLVNVLKALADDSLPTYGNSFDQKFDPTAYDNVEL